MADLAIKTKAYPRLEGNVLYLYEGDTFAFDLTLDLSQDGEPITIEPTDVATFEFKNERGEIIATQTFTDISDNKVRLNWDAEFTSHFPKGKYTYRVKFTSDYTTTIVADNMVVVC